MKGRIFFVGAVIAFVAVVPTVYWLLFERGLSVSGPSSPAPAAPLGLTVKLIEQVDDPAPMALSVTELEGSVEITRAGKADWRRAEEGMVLAAQDRIRTLLGAKATLAMPGVFSVKLSQESEFKVRHLAQNAYRFLLEQGMIAADVLDDADHIFEVASSTSVATTRGGQFRMHVNGEGLVAVGTSRGTVELESSGKVVQIREGFLALAERGKAPRDPIQIPNQLFLKVRWPSKTDRSKRTLSVAGKTDPGARVQIDGVTVEVDSSGNFRALKGLKEGSNRVRIQAKDVGGNGAKARSPIFKVDTRADGFKIDTSPEMWEKRKRENGK